MSDFFNKACQSTSSKAQFGLCDDPPPATAPAYIDENAPSKWIATVHNLLGKEVDFFAIDHCVNILKADGNQESRCDGLIFVERGLIFVELKESGRSGWLAKARDQLTITIHKFQEVNQLSDYDKVEAYACNKLKPFSIQGNNIELQKFKNDTGLIMRAQAEIYI